MREFEEQSVYSSGHPQRGRYERKPTKRKKKQTKLMALIVAILLIVVVACIFIFSGPKVDSKLLGKWRYNEYTAYEFYDNGKGCLCVDDVHFEYTFKTSSNKLTLDFAEDVVRDCEYTFSVDGNELTIVGGEGTDKGTYKLKKEK